MQQEEERREQDEVRSGAQMHWADVVTIPVQRKEAEDAEGAGERQRRGCMGSKCEGNAHCEYQQAEMDQMADGP